MVPRHEGWTVVLAGHWNRMIFTPAWVGQHLFQAGQQLETLVAILPVLPLIYQDAQTKGGSLKRKNPVPSPPGVG